MSKISVIVPVYKVEAYIHRCVDSILGQSCGDFELILVDDGSPDNCGAICDDYARKDGRIHVIHQKNGGLSAARNAGIDWVFANSDSQWITFVDSDDWIHTDYLKVLIQAAQQGTVKMSACGLIRTAQILPEEEVSGEDTVCLDARKAYCDYYGMFMTACCKLWHRDLLKELRFPVGKLHEDCYITHIPLFEAGKVAVCDVPLYYYFTNPGSITRVKWSQKRLEELEAHELRAAWLKERGYDEAYRREIEVYVMTIYEQTEVLAKLSREDSAFVPHLKKLRKKLLRELKKAKQLGLYAFEREYLWMYLMAYPTLPAWYAGQWLRNKRNSKAALE